MSALMFETAFCQCRLIKVFSYLLVGFIALVIYVRFLEATSIFLPTRAVLTNPQNTGLAYQDIYLTTVDKVKLHGWLIPSPNAKSTTVFLHGNAGNVGDRIAKIEILHRLSLNVLIIDYRGYGLSQGRPTERGIYSDALAAYDYLHGRADLAGTKVIAYGVSLGGAAAIELARQRPVDALIVESTFTTAADMARKIVPFVPSFLLNVKFDNLGKIPFITAPKLFIHSDSDEMVPYAFGKKLYDAAQTPKAFIKISGTHNEGHITSQAFYQSGIKDFLEKNDLID